MNKFLADRVAIITASTKVTKYFINKNYYIFQGIGYAIARRLGLEGASVVVSSRKLVNVKVFFNLY